MAVRLEVRTDGVAIVSLAAPDLNIFDLEMRDEFIEAISAVRDHPDARSLLLRADGRHFSAGADLSEFGTAETVFEARRIRWERDPWMLLYDLPQPSIAALHGYAVGAGFEASLLCDFRFASPDVRVGLPETSLGMLPAAAGTQSLSRVIGPAAALQLVLTGEMLDAADALRRGLVNKVSHEVEEAALVVASQLAALPYRAARAAKRAVRVALDVPLRSGISVERDLALALTAHSTMTGSPASQSSADF